MRDDLDVLGERLGYPELEIWQWPQSAIVLGGMSHSNVRADGKAWVWTAERPTIVHGVSVANPAMGEFFAVWYSSKPREGAERVWRPLIERSQRYAFSGYVPMLNKFLCSPGDAIRLQGQGTMFVLHVLTKRPLP